MTKTGNSGNNEGASLDEITGNALTDAERSSVELGARIGAELRRLRESAGYTRISVAVRKIYDEIWDVSPSTVALYVGEFERGSIGRLRNSTKPEQHSQIISALLALYGVKEKEARRIFNNIRKLAPKVEYPRDLKPR